MSKNCTPADAPVRELQNEAARKRWELFHLAIAHAKRSNAKAMLEADSTAAEAEHARPLLSLTR